MRNFNTGSAQYNNFGQFSDYLSNLWGGQNQPQIPAAPWVNPDTGTAAPWQNPDLPTQAAPWVNPDAPKDDAKRKMMQQLLAKPAPTPVEAPPATLKENQTQIISAPEAPEQLAPRGKRFVGNGGGDKAAKPSFDMKNMRMGGGF